MKSFRKKLTVNTKTRRAFVNITPDVEAATVILGDTGDGFVNFKPDFGR